MDKIVRIHVAKVPYEMSVEAQEELKKYFHAIHAKLDANLADEIMADIEVRITEILSSRHVQPNGVISQKDVRAIQDQLGTPEQFSQDDEPEELMDGLRKKRLLRNPDDAYVAGVASGLGAYFGVEPVFIRILFVVLAFVSGLGIALYLLFWLLVPAAKSSSEKLQMVGKPVTVATLQRYRATIQERLGSGPSNIHMAIMTTFEIIGKLLRVGVSALAALGMVYVLGSLAAATSLTFIYPFRPIFRGYHLDYLALGLLWVIGISLVGLLVSLVVRLWGRGSSRLKLTVISCVGVLVLALAASGAAAVPIYNHFSNKYGNGKSNVALAITNETPKVAPTKLLVLSDQHLNLSYVVVNDQPIHATYQNEPGLGKPDISIVNNKGILSIDSTNLALVAPNCLGNVCQHIYLPVNVTIYGPQIGDISDINGATLTLNNVNLGKSANLFATDNSQLYINDSYATAMNIVATRGGNVLADSTSVQQATVTLDSTATVATPVAVNINANLPLDCGMDGGSLNLNNYSGQLKINGRLESAGDLMQNSNSCVSTDF